MIMNCRLYFWGENLVSGRGASLSKGSRLSQQRVNKICALLSLSSINEICVLSSLSGIDVLSNLYCVNILLY